MELPLYRIVIDMDDPETGMTAISLVEHPAIEVPFIRFATEQLFSTDDEKHIITGPAILADTPIYRYSPQRGEYQIIFEKETIRQLVEKYSVNGLFNSVNLQHKSDTYVNSAILIESLIIDKERGVCPNEFSELPDGSWIVSYKITDNQLWDSIKSSGEFNGFSIEILSEIELVTSVNKNNSTQNMNKLYKMAKTILKLESIPTDKETLVIQGELEVGKPVFVETEEGPIDAPDGEYTLEDGTIVVVEGGVIAEIRPVEEKPEEETPAEEVLEEEETPAEENTEVEELKNRIAELEAEIEKKDTRIAELEAEIANKDTRIAELEAEIANKDTRIAELEAEIEKKDEQLKLSVETPLTKQKDITNKENKALKYFS